MREKGGREREREREREKERKKERKKGVKMLNQNNITILRLISK